MNRPQLGPLCMATARAIVKSPDNIVPLPWVALAMTVENRNHATLIPLTPSVPRFLDDSELIPGY